MNICAASHPFVMLKTAGGPACPPAVSPEETGMKKHILPAVIMACAASLAAAESAPSLFDGQSWWTRVKVLADDNMEGRDTGSDGLKRAQAYAVKQFEQAGLEPAGVNG